MDILNRQFGLIIAYLLPGFVALVRLAPLVPTVGGWLKPANYGVAPPMYALLAATAAGMVVSCFRWLVIDRIHARTGVTGPVFNARALEDRPSAFTGTERSPCPLSTGWPAGSPGATLHVDCPRPS